MTLLTLFNKALKEIPSISENLQNSIKAQRWSKEKTQQAITIVQQLQGSDLLGPYKYVENYVTLCSLTIILSPCECGINNSATFGPENIQQAHQYMEELLKDINRLSSDLKFSLRGHYYEDNECEFGISWEF